MGYNARSPFGVGWKKTIRLIPRVPVTAGGLSGDIKTVATPVEAYVPQGLWGAVIECLRLELSGRARHRYIP